MKIKYTIERIKLNKNNYKHVVYKNVRDHGICSRKLFEGSLLDCRKYLKTIKER